MIFSPEPLNRLGSNFFSVDKIRCLFEWVKSACWNFSVRAAISMCTCSTSKTWSSAKVHMHFSLRKRNLFRSAKKGFISTQNCVPFWHSVRAPISLVTPWKNNRFFHEFTSTLQSRRLKTKIPARKLFSYVLLILFHFLTTVLPGKYRVLVEKLTFQQIMLISTVIL